MDWRRPEFKVPLNWQWINLSFSTPQPQLKTVPNSEADNRCKERPSPVVQGPGAGKWSLNAQKLEGKYLLHFLSLKKKILHSSQEKNFNTTKMNYLGIISSSNCTQNLFSETHITLIKEIKKDLNEWRGIQCSWMRRLNTVKRSVPLKLIHIFNTLPVKILAEFLYLYTS